MFSVNINALNQALGKFWLKEAKFITAVELDSKRFGFHYKRDQIKNNYAFNYDQFPLSKDIFQHIRELRVLHTPEDLSVCDNFFGHDIKKILIWDNAVPKKYIDIQKRQNSLEEVCVSSRNGFYWFWCAENGFDHLSIISRSCKKLVIEYFKMENAWYLYEDTATYSSIEHLIIRRGHLQGPFNLNAIEDLCKYITLTFPNLNQLEIDFDCIDDQSSTSAYWEFLDVETTTIFNALLPKVKGTIKVTKYKIDPDFGEKNCHTPSSTSESNYIINELGNKCKIEKVKIHDGLFLETIVHYHDEHFLQYHKLYDHNGIFRVRRDSSYVNKIPEPLLYLKSSDWYKRYECWYGDDSGDEDDYNGDSDDEDDD